MSWLSLCANMKETSSEAQFLPSKVGGLGEELCANKHGEGKRPSIEGRIYAVLRGCALWVPWDSAPQSLPGSPRALLLLPELLVLCPPGSQSLVCLHVVRWSSLRAQSCYFLILVSLVCLAGCQSRRWSFMGVPSSEGRAWPEGVCSWVSHGALLSWLSPQFFCPAGLPAPPLGPFSTNFARSSAFGELSDFKKVEEIPVTSASGLQRSWVSPQPSVILGG